MNNWQLCPKCNGTGRMQQQYATVTSSFTNCDVCNGAKIISSLTGLPPNHTKIVIKEPLPVINDFEGDILEKRDKTIHEYLLDKNT